MRTTLSLIVVLSSTAVADDWPGFLGPDRNGISRETGLNFDWRSTRPKTVWSVPLGAGFSSLSVVGDRIFTGVKRGERDHIVCVNAKTGETVWTRDAAPSFLDTQGHGGGPRATPTFHAGRIYCLMGGGELVCLKADDGTPVWTNNVFDATGAPRRLDETYYWGMSASPLVFGDVVICQPGGPKGGSVAAFNLSDGKLAWSVGDDPPGYGSPVPFTVAGKPAVLAGTGQGAMAIDPGGKLLWRYAFGNKYNCNCATPVLLEGGRVFLSSAYGTGAVMLQTDGPATPKPVWENKQIQNQFATSVVLDDKIYGCHGDLGATMLRCVDAKTGTVLWTAREPGKCSLIAAEGHLICLSENGVLRSIAANPKAYTVRGELTGLLTRRCWAPPALAGKRLYVRDEKVLLCLDLAR